MRQKTTTHTTRKRCTKCSRAGWYRPRERTCKHVISGRWSPWYCGGPLVPAPIERTPKPAPSRSAQLEKEHARAFKAHAAATRREQAAQSSRRRWWAKLRRLNRAISEAKDAERIERAASITRTYHDE